MSKHKELLEAPGMHVWLALNSACYFSTAFSADDSPPYPAGHGESSPSSRLQNRWTQTVGRSSQGGEILAKSWQIFTAEISHAHMVFSF